MANYENIVEGKFIDRPNRFIAKVSINGIVETVHVKNTGRCKELLIPGCKVFLERSNNQNRKTQYDLIGVYKECDGFTRIINMDSQIPNQVAYEWIMDGGLGFIPNLLKREVKYGNSRFDLYGEADEIKFFVEVKGVTLEEGGIVKFPDAPTIRGIKHINELSKCINEGYLGFIIFIIQMSDVKFFTPNYDTHKEFGEALEKACRSGVKVIALECEVNIDSIKAIKEVEICF